jgi:hypothetical protein
VVGLFLVCIKCELDACFCAWRTWWRLAGTCCQLGCVLLGVRLAGCFAYVTCKVSVHRTPCGNLWGPAVIDLGGIKLTLRGGGAGINSRLAAQDQDQEVKECAILCMAHLVATCGDLLSAEVRGVCRN